MSEKKLHKSLIKGTGIYAIGTFGTKILSFLLVPLYTYYINPEDMGVYDLLMTTMNLISPIITLQIADAAFRWIIRDEDNRPLYIRTTLQAVATNCMIAILVIGLVNKKREIPYCALFSALLFITLMTGVLQKTLRGLRNQKLFVISGIVHSVVYLSLNVLQICVLHNGIRSLFISAITSYLITTAVILLFEKRTRVNCLQKIHLETLKMFYRFSIPLVPNYLNWWVINSSDRYIVSFVLGVSANGILAVAHKFPSTFHAILALFNTAWQDIAVSDKDDSGKSNFGSVFREYYKLVFSFMWVLVPFTKVIAYLILSPAYKVGCDYAAFYYLGTIFQSFSSFYGVGYLRNENTGKAFTTSIYAAVINVVINLALIRFIGIQAAAVSTFVSFFVMWIIRERQNRKELGITINWKEVLGYTLSCVVLSVISIRFSLTVNIWLFIISALLFVKQNWVVVRKLYAMISNKVKASGMQD